MAGNDSNTKLLIHANQGNTVKSAFCHMIMENNTDSGSGANTIDEVNSPTYTSGHIGNSLELVAASSQCLSLGDGDSMSEDVKADTTGTIALWFNTDVTGAN